MSRTVQVLHSCASFLKTALRAGSKNGSAGRLHELERAESSSAWKILLATDALHFQDSVQDDTQQASGKAKLQVACSVLCPCLPSQILDRSEHSAGLCNAAMGLILPKRL